MWPLCFTIRCICGLLKNKCRILVTHQLQHLRAADQILVLKEVCAPLEHILIKPATAFSKCAFLCGGQICRKLYFIYRSLLPSQQTESVPSVCSGGTAPPILHHEAIAQISNEILDL